MNKTAKSLLIPIAAFAVTATGVSAFNSDMLVKAGLSNEQISAFEEAHELRQEGDKEAAREVLVAAGIDLSTMHALRQAHHEAREEHQAAIEAAVENNDYEAFRIAIEGSPLNDIITSEADFISFVKAHEMRSEAKDILAELGLPSPSQGRDGTYSGGYGHKHHEGLDDN